MEGKVITISVMSLNIFSSWPCPFWPLFAQIAFAPENILRGCPPAEQRLAWRFNLPVLLLNLTLFIRELGKEQVLCFL